MARLPSHWLVYAEPENATAQTVPSLATIVPHILKPRPLLPVAPTAPSSADWRVAWLGKLEQIELPSATAEPAADETASQTAPAMTQG
jgi:hypothetical protein